MRKMSDSTSAVRTGRDEKLRAGDIVPAFVRHNPAPTGSADNDTKLTAFQFTPGHWAIEWAPPSGAPIVLNGLYTSRRAADAAIPRICERLAFTQRKSAE